MPSKSLRFCNHNGCGELTDKRYCPQHEKEHEERETQRKTELDRNRMSSTERGYDGRWRKARITYLSHHPLCAECEREGKIAPATVVDHIIPHKGDQKLFWDTTNWQPLCKRHHDIKTAQEDGRWGK